jgi:hypothetical protein
MTRVGRTRVASREPRVVLDAVIVRRRRAGLRPEAPTLNIHPRQSPSERVGVIVTL